MLGVSLSPDQQAKLAALNLGTLAGNAKDAQASGATPAGPVAASIAASGAGASAGTASAPAPASTPTPVEVVPKAALVATPGALPAGAPSSEAANVGAIKDKNQHLWNGPAGEALQHAMEESKRQAGDGAKDWKDKDGNEIVKRRNSATDAALWAKFTRKMAAEGKHHESLVPWYMEDKCDMFNAWVLNNNDLTACELVLKRRRKRRTTGKASYGWRKLRDVAKETYGGNMDKAKKAVEGKPFQDDESHPKDEEERWYWVMTNRGSLDLENITEESEEVNAKGDLSAEQAAELGGAGGLLTMPPKVPGMSDEQSTAFLAGINNLKQGSGGKKDPNKPPKDEGEKTEEEKEKERIEKEKAEIVKNMPITKASALAERLLKCSSQAQKFAVALNGIGVTQGMATWMGECQTLAENLYKDIQSKTIAGKNEETDYKEVTDSANVLLDVFDQYSPLATQMSSRLKAKRKPEGEAAPRKARKTS